jgi:hypothetical protein
MHHFVCVFSIDHPADKDEGNKLRGDWHLLKSHERYRHALELATEMPESLGLSTSFRGKDEHSNGRAFAPVPGCLLQLSPPNGDSGAIS